MKLLKPIFLAGVLMLGGGCANWSPFVRDSKCQRIWGYPPEILAKVLNIPSTDRSRLEDFYGEAVVPSLPKP